MEHNVCTGISNVRYFSPRLLAALTGILSSVTGAVEDAVLNLMLAIAGRG